jgi:LuxR family maltose regulon positive regulatory protein
MVLVLDDYHVITSAAVNRAVGFLLENLPPNLHLVISTRADPPIPIARLRSRGQVVEIRADDLRFTPGEAVVFLNQIMGVALSPEQAAALGERTEGWIAGLQMAALSLRGREDVDAFIKAFAGTHRFIMDYLLEEVLAREPEDVQVFLLQTSILSRLSGALCDAVTGGVGAQEMLERLERHNLFVVPLDDERRWYRYHHLFASLLQARLYQSGAHSVAGLLSRAAEWCQQEGLVAEAVDYALAAHDYGRATALVARHWQHMMYNGESDTVWSWLHALPETVVRGSAPLSIAYSWMLWLNGQVGAIEPHLADAQRALSGTASVPGSTATDEISRGLAAELAALRSIVARYRCDFDTARTLARRALELVPENLSPRAGAQLRVLVYLAAATAYDGAGDLEHAVGAYAETIRWSRAGTNAVGIAGITNRLVGLLRLLGRLRAAEEACQAALGHMEAHGMARLPATGMLHLAMSDLLLERNDLDAAEAHLSRAVELGRWLGRFGAAKSIVEARLKQARQDTTGALAALAEGEAALGEPPSCLARAELLSLKARILLRQGSLSEAARCVEEAVRLGGQDRGQTGEMVALAACRVRLAQCKADEAVAQVTPLLAAAEASGRLGTALEMRILRSLARAELGDASGAHDDLEHALALGESENYVRIFVDEGEPMSRLLRELRGNAGPFRTYVDRLLSAFSPPGVPPAACLPDPHGASRSPRSLSHPASLIEPLTERELEVLRLMAEGLTNKEIAARLIIALGTVKAHIHHISGKLCAENRAHAVARAKELGLL